MPFSGTTFAEVSAGANRVNDLLSDYRRQMLSISQSANSLVSAMTAFGTEWGPIVAAAGDLLATNPNNVSFQVLNSNVQSLVADFNALSAEAAALESRISQSQ